MDRIERVKMVKAMEFIARQINDEDVFCEWLTVGVADGDITYGDLNAAEEDADTLEYYLEDDNFGNLMGVFLGTMKCAYKSGGLYCDEITSK